MITRNVFDLFDAPSIFTCMGCVYENIPGNEAPCKLCINHNHFLPVKSCTTCKHGDLREDEGVCAECDGKTHHEAEEPIACSTCVNAELSSTSDQCFRCKDDNGYVDVRNLNDAIDEATDDQQSCHRCIHIGTGFNSTSNEGACADCDEHSHFKQNARQIVFNSQVGGSHYKNPDVPEGFPDPAEFCIMHGLGGAETAVIKYVFRHSRKDGVKDLKKAKQYLEFIAACRYNEII